MEVKTSQTSPIRVDFLEEVPLGLTFAPGKRGPSLVGRYRWERDIGTDVARLVNEYEVDVLVTLIEEHEFEQLEVTGLREAVRHAGIVSHWFPIVDGGVPEQLGSFVALVRTMTSSLNTGDRVVVHCRGGLGRAGTVAASVLVALGENASDAMAAVRTTRPGAIENDTQEEFVASFERFWRGRPKSE